MTPPPRIHHPSTALKVVPEVTIEAHRTTALPVSIPLSIDVGTQGRGPLSLQSGQKPDSHLVEHEIAAGFTGSTSSETAVIRSLAGLSSLPLQVSTGGGDSQEPVINIAAIDDSLPISGSEECEVQSPSQELGPEKTGSEDPSASIGGSLSQGEEEVGAMVRQPLSESKAERKRRKRKLKAMAAMVKKRKI